MKSRLPSLVLLALTAPAVAHAGERADAILRRQSAHGYRSAAAALAQLQAADDRPLAGAPLDLRRRYFGAIAQLAVTSRQPTMVAAARDALTTLDGMARNEGCAPCRTELLLARAQDALTRREPDEAERDLRAAEGAVAGAPAETAARFHYARARLYNIRGNFSGGIAEALQAADLAERAGDEAGRIMTQALLVSMAAALADYGRADEIAREAYEDARRIGFTYAMASLRLNQAYAYGRSGRAVLQASALDEALRLSRGQVGMEEFEAVSLSNLADHWLMEQDYARALDYARQAEALARRSGDPRSLSYALTNAGVATAHLGKVDEGLRLVREAMTIAERLGARNDLVGITGELVGIYKHAGRYRDALDSLEQVAALQRELTRQERDKSLLEMQERYAAQGREREIDRLEAANKLKQAELAARTWQQRLWAALAVVLALATLAGVQWIKRVRRDNRRLSGDVATLSEQSLHDPLTGVANRRQCQLLMSRHVGRSGDALPVGLLLIDVDFFKRVNDTWGHGAGDRVLVEIASRLRALVREQDTVVRWGGEEFALLLPGTGPEGMAALAERALFAIGSQPVDIDGSRIDVTVSIGGAFYPLQPGVDWHHAMHVADLALYLSKSGGRNRSTCIAHVAPGADVVALGRDLAAAQGRGDVRLVVGEGPVSGAVAAGAAVETA